MVLLHASKVNTVKMGKSCINLGVIMGVKRRYEGRGRLNERDRNMKEKDWMAVTILKLH